MIKGKVTIDQKQLVSLLNRLKNPRPALEEIGRVVTGTTQNRIRTEKTDPAGTPWQPWATSTTIARIKKGTASRGLLYDSGNLLNSITYQVSGKQVSVGSSGVPYAIYLQQGTPNMPARPFIGYSNKDMQYINAILTRFVSGQT